MRGTVKFRLVSEDVRAFYHACGYSGDKAQLNHKKIIGKACKVFLSFSVL